jgi:hypothetical protein
MLDLQRGDLIVVRDALGNQLQRRALGPVDPGDTFPVVWAVREDEWQAAMSEGREPDATPWPVEDVSLADEVTA